MKNPIVFGIIYVLLALTGDVFLKLWADRTIQGRMLLLAMAIHGTASAAWAYQMRLGAGFGRSAIVLILANLVGAVVLARLLFGEIFTSQHIAGMIAAIIAIILLV